MRVAPHTSSRAARSRLRPCEPFKAARRSKRGRDPARRTIRTDHRPFRSKLPGPASLAPPSSSLLPPFRPPHRPRTRRTARRRWTSLEDSAGYKSRRQSVSGTRAGSAQASRSASCLRTRPMAIATATTASMAALLAAAGASQVDIPPVGTFDEMKTTVWYPKFRELVELLNFRVMEKSAYVFGGSIADNWFLTALRLVDVSLEHDLKQVLQEQFTSPGKLERWDKSVQFVDFLPMEDREVPGRVINLQFINNCRLIGCTMTDGAKIRFSCGSCAHNWTSMKGRITFWCIFSERDITLSPLAIGLQSGLAPTPTPLGTVFPPPLLFKQGANVFFKLYSQDCSQCPCKQIEPKWYQEEIKKVLENFFVQLYTAFYKGLFPWDGKFNHERRVGNPNKPHPSSSCDACRLGICAQSQGR